MSSVRKIIRPYQGHTRFPTKFWEPMYPFTAMDSKLNPAIPGNVVVRKKPIRLNSMWLKGNEGRLQILAANVTELLRLERVEMSLHRAEEVRGYTERLIVEAMRNGDCHRPTMELASFWLKEKQLVHKLFKVLVPRYVNYSESFTALFKLPPRYADTAKKGLCKSWLATTPIGVLELKGNPLPPIKRPLTKNKRFLTNVLLDAAKNDFYNNKQ